MKNLYCIICLFLSVFIITGCGTTNGYIGKKIPETELAVIRGVGNKSVQDRFPFNLEKILIVKIDTMTVGSYKKGWPKQVKVFPGKRIIEVRHYQAWDKGNKEAPQVFNPGGFLGGFASGYVAGEHNEHYSIHYHYILTFDVLKGKNYSILFKTTDSKINKPEIFITEDESGSSIPFDVVEKFYKKNSTIMKSDRQLK